MSERPNLSRGYDSIDAELLLLATVRRTLRALGGQCRRSHRSTSSLTNAASGDDCVCGWRP
jgi:hypothetical protein